MCPFVDHHRMSRRRRPSPGVPSLQRFRLLPDHRIRIRTENTVIEKTRHHFYPMFITNSQKFIQRFQKIFRIIGIYGILQYHPCTIQAQLLGRFQFPVDQVRRKTGLIPHSRVINGIRRNIIHSTKPSLFFKPIFTLCFTPARRLSKSR